MLMLLAIWIGAKVEERRAERAPDTLFLYTTPKVCAANWEDPESSHDTTLSFHTLDSADSVHSSRSSDTPEPTENEMFIAHCGDCGKCSNPHDIAIYDDTRNTLFETTVMCAKKSFLFGRTVAHECMDENIGFTDGCRDCWVENIVRL